MSQDYISPKGLTLADFPSIFEEYDHEKNDTPLHRGKEIKPEQITAGSHKYVWWCCSNCNHQWQAPPKRRTGTGSGCEICARAIRANRRAIPEAGHSLAEKFPDIAKEWSEKLNGELKPNMLKPGSNKQIWWECANCNREWQAPPVRRTGTGAGCLPCAAKERAKMLTIPDAGQSLADIFPELINEWHPTMNNELKPTMLKPASNKSVWWKCSTCGHEWKSPPARRTTGVKSGCNKCGYVKSAKANSAVERDKSFGVIYPELAKEWHSTLNGSLTPYDVKPKSSSHKRWWKCEVAEDHIWETEPAARASGEGCPCCAGKKVVKSNCLATTHPDLAKLFHPTKNGELTTSDLTAGSNKKVWWKCNVADDHEWEAAPMTVDRSDGNGCPCCSGHKVVKSNCLATTYPELAREFHPTKNGELTPSDVLGGGAKKRWWKCDVAEDHEWKAAISSRIRGNGCPFCGGRRVSISNNLADCFPNIAAQWHPTKNGELTSNNVTSGTHKKVWWKCEVADDHEWETSVQARTGSGTGCPCCAGHKVVKSNCLETTHPEITAQWHPTKNGDLTPQMVVGGTQQKVWWKCSDNLEHEAWFSSIGNRTNPWLMAGCHTCGRDAISDAQSRPIEGQSFADVYPNLAEQWHPTKNGQLTPYDLAPRSNKKVWWKCEVADDHEWDAPSNNRSKQPLCPFCTNKRTAKSNSMASTNPTLAEEWHPTKNGELTPELIVAGSSIKVWWQCKANPEHEWPAVCSSRPRNGCPYCTIVPRSKPEILVMFELQQFFEIDFDDHKIVLGGKIRDIDLIFREHNLAVEYDGSYWHRDKIAQDTEKTRLLTESGWTVIRAREFPLKPLSDNDIVVPLDPIGSGKIKETVNLILEKICHVFGIKNVEINGYITRQECSRTEEAEDYILELQKRRV
ncbi:zinc-ribbon domain-containing protein [Candidatus Poseidonia alphae]|nr:zinc-ribbon domain-containing protein [Candidatus Poseidonia alphae]